MPYVVMVAMTMDEPTPEEAIAFVQRDLREKLGDGDGGFWQTEKPHILPRWQVTSVR